MHDPWVKWYTGDWLRDPKVSMLSPAARGIWFDALCCMIESCTHTLSGTPDQLARALRCCVSDLSSTISELEVTGAGEVRMGNGKITITNRRRRREARISEIRAESGRKGMAVRWQNNKRHNKQHNKALTSDSDSNSLNNSGEGGHGEGVSSTPEVCPAVPITTDSKAVARRNLHYDAYAESYAKRFRAAYVPSKADFVHLVALLKADPGVTPARIAEVASGAWALGGDRDGKCWERDSASSLRGLCAHWPRIVAKIENDGRSKQNVGRNAGTSNDPKRYANLRRTK